MWRICPRIDEQVGASFTSADVEGDDAAKFAARLTGVRKLAHRQGDRALTAMVVAAEEMAVRWDRERCYVKVCGDELRRARESAAASKRRLAVLLDVIEEASRASTAAGERQARSPRRFLFSSRRRAAQESVPTTALVPPLEPPGPVSGSETDLHDDSHWPDLGRDRQPSVVAVAPPAVRPAALAAHDDPGVAEGPPNVRDIVHRPRDVDLAVQLLGTFRLFQHGEPVDTRNNAKSLRVLKYLVCHRDHPVPKDVLIELFWPESDLDTVGRNLHQAIYTLRKILKCRVGAASQILFDNGAYLINPELSLWCDVDEFEASAAEGKDAELAGQLDKAVAALSRAERCYEGDYLADTPYEEWALGDRERLRLKYVEVANRLGNLLLETGDIDGSVSVSLKLLAHEPCDECAHRRLIRCYAAGGHRNLVIRQYQAYVACADRLYGLGPSPETTALYESLIAD
jgi:DNA-binding SARP family transcriptional activator